MPRPAPRRSMRNVRTPRARNSAAIRRMCVEAWQPVSPCSNIAMGSPGRQEAGMFSCSRSASPSASATTCRRRGGGHPRPGRQAPSSVWTWGLLSSGNGRKSRVDTVIVGPRGHPYVTSMTADVQPDRPTPRELGYRMPAEWEPHAATWVAWPHQRDDWPGKFEPVPWVYVEIVRHLHRSERVRIVAMPPEQDQAREMLARGGIDLSRIDFIPFPTDRVWLRDSAAIFVKDGEGKRAALDWHFNAWAKYDNWQDDDRLPEQIAAHLGVPRWQPRRGGRRVVLEGGSIDVDGQGLLLTTEECLLSPVQARNPGLTRADVEEVLRDYLGVGNVLWLNRGIAGDDTHGHVDDLARFVAPGHVVAVVEDDRGDENYEPLRENLDRLRGMKAIKRVTTL